MQINHSAQPIPSAAAAVQMLPAEQEILAALTFALRPERVLEIGTCEGGSAAIIVNSMNRRGAGRLVCIDPEPRIPPELWEYLTPRTQILTGTSPSLLATAQRMAGGKFHFALIDGDHSYSGAFNDLVGCVEHMEDGAHVLLHDAHYYEVAQAIKGAVKKDKRLTDCGLISTDVSVPDPSSGVKWGGLHLCRVNTVRSGWFK